ncbi:40S ribosomal protein SA-like [Nycticebus coucang]|uniref:40S ribosomal protein SA-like n=1 Tax=Nycticebus coucang TaxID=9470 RepID=UPI00234E264D|nr:40S ribosomal protein SA-like [Nycticebus coucang]
MEGPYSIVLDSHGNLKGKFHNVQNASSPANEGEDVLKFLVLGTHFGGTNLDFQMKQYIYKKKSDGISIINLKRTWETLLLAAHAIVAIENPADFSVISSRNTGQQLCRSLLLPLEPLLLMVASLPEPSPARSRQHFRSLVF